MRWKKEEGKKKTKMEFRRGKTRQSRARGMALMARDDADVRMFCLAAGTLGSADRTVTFHNLLLPMTWLGLSAISQSTEFLKNIKCL
jgi:hypothetical protein